MEVKMQATSVPGLFIARHGSNLHLVTSDIEHIRDEERPMLEWLGQLDKHGNYVVFKDRSWSVELELKSDYSFVANDELVRLIEEDY